LTWQASSVGGSVPVCGLVEELAIEPFGSVK
jgi:hypothetical protein